MSRSDDLTTRVLSKIDSALPDWTQSRHLYSVYLATGAAGAEAREKVEIDDEEGGIENLVAVDIEATALGTLPWPGGGIIITGTAITNATIASADGSGDRLFIPIPPVHNAGAVNTSPAIQRRHVFPSPVTIAGNDAFIYLVSNAGAATTAAVAVSLYENRSDKTFPTTIAGAFTEQADV